MRPGCHWCTQWQLGSLTRPRDRLQRTVEAHHAGLMGHGDRSMGQVHHWHGPRSPPRHCQGGPGATTSAGPQAAVTSESGLRGGRSVGGSAGRLGSCRCDRRGLFSDTGPIVALLARFWPGAPIAHVRANQPAQWSRSPLLSMLVELPLTKLGLALPPRWHATGFGR